MNEINSILNKDKIWSRIKNYIYLILALITLLFVLILVILIVNTLIYLKLSKST
jgi:hypothetical protein